MTYHHLLSPQSPRRQNRLEVPSVRVKVQSLLSKLLSQGQIQWDNPPTLWLTLVEKKMGQMCMSLVCWRKLGHQDRTYMQTEQHENSQINLELVILVLDCAICTFVFELTYLTMHVLFLRGFFFKPNSSYRTWIINWHNWNAYIIAPRKCKNTFVFVCPGRIFFCAIHPLLLITDVLLEIRGLRVFSCAPFLNK